MKFFTDLKARSDVKWLQSAREIGHLLNDYLAQLRAGAGVREDERSILLVVSSVCSPAVYALARKCEQLAENDICLQIILADIGDAEALQAVRDMLAPLPARSQIRQLVNPAMLDANEQLFLGAGLSWSGDTLRRGEQSNAVAVISRTPDQTMRFGRRAFAMLWQASAPLSGPGCAAGRPPTVAGEMSADVAMFSGAPQFLNEDDGELHPLH